jgi:molybdenum cofactor synthesis domain-containing protein
MEISRSREPFPHGSFAENITTRDLPHDIRVFDILKTGNVELLVSQIGKEFHEKIQFPGHYVSPQKAIFCRVKKGGMIKAGDILMHTPKTFKTLVITLSDRAQQGIYKDESGPEIKQIIRSYYEKSNYRFEIEEALIPDRREELENLLQKAHTYDLVLSTGGTGISASDITIETLQAYLDKEIPGITEIIRWKYGLQKPQTLLSRSLAGSINKTLVFAMPGSPKAVREYMHEFTPMLNHAFRMLHELGH